MRDKRAVRLRVGAKIRQLRRLRGLSQEQLAEMVGNSQKHMGQVERGEVNVTIDILTAVAAKLSVDVGELFRAGSGETGGPRVYTLTQRDVDQLEQGLKILDRLKRAGG